MKSIAKSVAKFLVQDVGGRLQVAKHFDAEFYRKQGGANGAKQGLRHYMKTGWKELV